VLHRTRLKAVLNLEAWKKEGREGEAHVLRQKAQLQKQGGLQVRVWRRRRFPRMLVLM
jgi:hypothetical protein